MTATNHALTGTAVALTISNPFIALPVALASHFICDAIPHFGLSSYEDRTERKNLFHRILYIDALLLAALMIFLLVSGASLVVFVCFIFSRISRHYLGIQIYFKEKFEQSLYLR